MPARPNTRRRPRPPGSAARREPVDPRQKALDAFLGTRAWRTLRKAYLREHPLCEDCRERGEVRPAAAVHHRIDRRDRPELSLDWDNLQALCKPDHDRRTRTRQNESTETHG